MEDFSDIFGLLPLDDPSFLTGMGLQFAGTALKADRLRRIRQQQAQTMAASQAQQAALQAEAGQKIAAATGKLSFQQQEADRAALRNRYERTFAAPVGEQVASEYSAGNPGAPSIVKDSIAAQMAEAARKRGEYAKNTAAVASYGGQGANNSVLLNRLGADVGRVANFSAGNSRILPYQLQSAVNSGEGRGVASDVFSGLGDIFTQYALRRKPAPRQRVPIAYAGTMD